MNPAPKEVAMSHLRVLICRVEDDKEMTELHSFDLPAVELEKLSPETALDEIETRMLDCGQKITGYLLRQQWVDIDEQLVEKYQQAFPPWSGDS
jgi:hypothetical protein